MSASLSDPPRPPHWLLAVPLVATAVVFLPGLGGAFLWDDLPLIAQNTFVTDPAQLPALLSRPFWHVSSIDGIGRAAYLNLYRPVVSLAYATQWRLFGDSPVGFHAVSLALHLGCVALAASWIRKRLPRSDGRPAWVAACLGVLPFALHPSRPEVVSWVSGSTDLYWTLFALFGLHLFERDRPASRGLGALCFLVSVLSKETAVVMPLVLLLDGWGRGRRPSWGREGLATLGTLLGGAIHLAVVPPQFIPSTGSSSSPVLRVFATLGEFVLRTAWPFDPSVGPAARTLDASGALTFAPHSVALGAGLLTGTTLLVAAAVRRPRLRPWTADLGLFLLPLFPVSNALALDGPTLVSDRFLYFSFIGVGAGLARAALPSIERGPPRRTAVLAVLGGLGLALGAVTSAHVPRFASADALWAYELERDPDSLQALRNATELALASGDRATAVALMSRTAEVATRRHENALAAQAGLRAASVLLQRTSDAEQARLEAFRQLFDGLASSDELSLEQPDLSLAVRLSADEANALRQDARRFGVPRALAHLRTGRLDAALAQLRALAQTAPDAGGLWTALATTHARRGEWEPALAAAAEGVRREQAPPSFVAQLSATERLSSQSVQSSIEAAVRDAEVQNRLGAPEAARRGLERALREAPAEPALIRGRVRADLADRRPDLARQVIARARRQAPELAPTWDAMERELEAAATPPR